MSRILPYILSCARTNSNCIVHHRIIHLENCRLSRQLHRTVVQNNSSNNVQSKSIEEELHQPSNGSYTKDLIKSGKGPSLKDFIMSSKQEVSTHDVSESIEMENIPYLDNVPTQSQKVYIEVYGCQMNVNDTEIVWGILQPHGYQKVESIHDADIVLLMTCTIREKADMNALQRLNYFRSLKRRGNTMKVGLLGCMASRLKNKIVDTKKLVDVVAGPDSYKDLPRLLAVCNDKETAINVQLSMDETYADVVPVRLNPSAVTAFVSIMRGCDNMCTYCVVPFTRGRERSRPIDSILDEVQRLSDSGVKEITLLGQNVNSYRDTSDTNFSMAEKAETHLAKGFKTVYKNKKGGRRFVDLLDKVSLINPELRIRFTSPHPKDFPDEVLQLIRDRPNVCRQLHLPAQSGNSDVLQLMRRGYTREAYIELVDRVREIIPDVALSSDFIAGFCGETEEQFQDTLSLIEYVRYTMAYLFCYSMRGKTTAFHRYKDDVERSAKVDRVNRMSKLFRIGAERLNKEKIGQLCLVLTEGVSKNSEDDLQGRNDSNTKVIFPSMDVPVGMSAEEKSPIKPGNYVIVRINDGNSQTLRGIPLCHSSIADFSSRYSQGYASEMES